MTITEIVLLKKVINLGDISDKVKVKAGYARNFLLPRKLAVLSKKINKQQIEYLHKAKTKQEMILLQRVNTFADKINSRSRIILTKTSSEGRMFGSITSSDIVRLINSSQMMIERQSVLLEKPIKQLGQYLIKIRLSDDLLANFCCKLVSDNANFIKKLNK